MRGSVEPPQSSRRAGRAFSPDWLHGQLENVRLESPTYKNVIAVSLCESNSAAEDLMNAKGRFDPEELLADARGGCAESFGKVLELNRTDLQGVRPILKRAATPAFMARAFRFGFSITIAVRGWPMPKSCRPKRSF